MPEASNPAARAKARKSHVSCMPFAYCFFQIVFHVLGSFLFVAFLFLFGFFLLVRSVADLLDAGVDLAAA